MRTKLVPVVVAAVVCLAGLATAEQALADTGSAGRTAPCPGRWGRRRRGAAGEMAPPQSRRPLTMV
jgi:hypothetical protein